MSPLNKLTSSQKKNSLFALSFFALFSFLSAPSIVFAADESNTQTSANTIISDKNAFESALAQSDVAAVEKLLLEKKVEVNKSLEIATNQQLPFDYGRYAPISLSKQAELIKLALENGAKFSTVNIYPHRNDCLPSSEAVEIIFKNPENFLDPSKFLNLVLQTSAPETNTKLVDYRYSLVKLALDKDAVPQKTGYFGSLPSLELTNLLLKHGLTPDKLLFLVLGTPYKKYNREKNYLETNNELLEQRNKLIRLALDKGAAFEAIIDSFKMESKADLEIPQKYNPSLYPSKYLISVLRDYHETYDSIKDTLSDKNKIGLIKLKDALVTLTMEYGADLQKIEYLDFIPSLDLSNILLEHRLTPNKFLFLVLGTPYIKYNPEKLTYEIDNELVAQRNKLIRLALDKGATFESLIEPVKAEIKKGFEEATKENRIKIPVASHISLYITLERVYFLHCNSMRKANARNELGY